jgi:tRNA(fMet)-specific endonuclease VapC
MESSVGISTILDETANSCQRHGSTGTIGRLAPCAPGSLVREGLHAIRAYLTAAGTPIGGNDLWITAHARASRLTLVTNSESEFRRVPDLRVENWVNQAGN